MPPSGSKPESLVTGRFFHPKMGVLEEASLLGLGALCHTCERRAGELRARALDKALSLRQPSSQLPRAGTPNLGGGVGRFRRGRTRGTERVKTDQRRNGSEL